MATVLPWQQLASAPWGLAIRLKVHLTHKLQVRNAHASKGHSTPHHTQQVPQGLSWDAGKGSMPRTEYPLQLSSHNDASILTLHPAPQLSPQES